MTPASSRPCLAGSAPDAPPGEAPTHRLAALRGALLGWFDRSRRDLPWRRDRTPYRVWLAEVMLQQTQVAAATPYFERFVERFPDAHSLARAPLPEVLALWKGLGYYSRARNLHRAAQQVAREGMPQSAQALRDLPGFGRYTAAAVASLAFGERVALVDGNVARVLSRLLAIDAPPGAPGREERLWAEAGTLLDPDRPGAFNEALMELGALVCTPARPRCEPACPLRPWCEACRSGRQALIPPPRARPVPEKLDLACAVAFRGGRLLLARRAEHGLFGGLWELPSVVVGPGATPARALEAAGWRPGARRAAATVHRRLTHRDLSLHLVPCAARRGRLEGYLEQRAVSREDLAAMGIATAMAQAIEKAFAVGAARRRG